MDTLIGIASHILYIYSIVQVILHFDAPMYSYDLLWEGSAILILFTNMGKTLQNSITKSSLEVYNKLNSLKKQVVSIKSNDEWIDVSADKVNINSFILIKKGEVVPLDGKLQQPGIFNYSNITGEAREVAISSNDTVMSGAFNLGDNVVIKTTSDWSTSTLNKIVEGIENVSASRPPMQQLADKILKYFVPGVLIAAVLTTIVWLVFGYLSNFHFSWIKNTNHFENALEAGVTTLAIACPCALGIATPLIYTVSSMLSAERGIVINNPTVLEEINKVSVLAFDKTGTLTSENLEVVKIHGEKKFLPIAVGLEQNIKHPIADAISKLTKTPEKDLTNIKYLENIGVSGNLRKQEFTMRTYVSHEFKADSNHTNVALYDQNDKALLVFELSNQVKEGVPETIRKLKKLNLEVIMITGDNKQVAKKIGDEAGITTVFANAKPSEKAKIINDLQEKGKSVCFIGDGFNDAIAMKKANVSIAFSSGSDITNSLSDVSIISHDFKNILSFLQISKLNKRWVKFSLFYAFSFNLVTIPIAMILLVQPWVGAAIMAISDVLVALNAFAYKMIGRKKLK